MRNALSVCLPFLLSCAVLGETSGFCHAWRCPLSFCSSRCAAVSIAAVSLRINQFLLRGTEQLFCSTVTEMSNCPWKHWRYPPCVMQHTDGNCPCHTGLFFWRPGFHPCLASQLQAIWVPSTKHNNTTPHHPPLHELPSRKALSSEMRQTVVW